MQQWPDEGIAGVVVGVLIAVAAIARAFTGLVKAVAGCARKVGHPSEKDHTHGKPGHTDSRMSKDQKLWAALARWHGSACQEHLQPSQSELEPGQLIDISMHDRWNTSDRGENQSHPISGIRKGGGLRHRTLERENKSGKHSGITSSVLTGVLDSEQHCDGFSRQPGNINLRSDGQIDREFAELYPEEVYEDDSGDDDSESE